MEWNFIRTFLAVVDEGSLLKASGLLGISQSTLSRQIAELEQSAGVALFERVARGLRLTVAGEALVEPARQMEIAARAAVLSISNHTDCSNGTVRITASEMTSAYVLPPILKRLRQDHPEIQIELVASNHHENLLERDADIAIRNAHPTQSSIHAKRIGTVKIGLFAHTDYLNDMGGQIDRACLTNCDWIGLDKSDFILQGFREAGQPVQREFFAFRCDNQIVGWQAALAGMGIGFAPVSIASLWPDMQMVMQDHFFRDIPVWLLAHRELRGNKRMRVVFDALAEGLQWMAAGH